MRLISDTDMAVKRVNISCRRVAATPCETISVQRPMRNASTARNRASNRRIPTARQTTCRSCLAMPWSTIQRTSCGMAVRVAVPRSITVYMAATRRQRGAR